MKNKGFTLIELMAVIIILIIITLISTPIVVNIIENLRKKAFEESVHSLIKAGKLYYAEQMVDREKLLDGKLFTIEDEMWEEDKLLVKGSLPKYGALKVNSEGKITVAMSNGKWCALKSFADTMIMIREETDEECITSDLKYKEKILEGAHPELPSNMLPVIIGNDGTVKRARTYKDWYKYENRIWSNAVVVADKTGVRAGNVISEDNILAYFVWIPRYSYVMPDISQTEISIKFGDINNLSKAHLAFTFGDRNLNGFWVGKFETGYQQKSDLTNTNSWKTDGSQISSADANGSKVLIKPNIPSWRYMQPSNMFKTARSMANVNSRYKFSSTNDPHMMKNIEWGAVAYLSHSIYGKYGDISYTEANKEVYQNKSTTFITGSSNGTPSQSTTLNQCLYNDTIDRGSGLGACGSGASTTGNISGIYDMSGGANEYVMGVMQQYDSTNVLVGKGGFSNGYVEGKVNIDDASIAHYLDKYEYQDYGYYRSRGKNGDATTELGPWRDSDNLTIGDLNRSSWYLDYAYFVFTDYTWFYRGGAANHSTNAGIFSFSNAGGGADNSFSFRIVVLGD